MNIKTQIKRHKGKVKTLTLQIEALRHLNKLNEVGILLSQKQDSINQIDKLKKLRF